MQSYWCYRCEDFTAHHPLTNNNTFCTICGRERESALTRPMSKLAEKVPKRESTRYVVRGYYNNRWYHLNHQHRWTEFQQDAKQFKEKREALEAFETTPRPYDDFYPCVLTIDDRDEDFTISDDNTEADGEIEDIDIPMPQVSGNLLIHPRIAGMLQPPTEETDD